METLITLYQNLLLALLLCGHINSIISNCYYKETCSTGYITVNLDFLRTFSGFLTSHLCSAGVRPSMSRSSLTSQRETAPLEFSNPWDNQPLYPGFYWWGSGLFTHSGSWIEPRKQIRIQLFYWSVLLGSDMDPVVFSQSRIQDLASEKNRSGSSYFIRV